MLPPEARRGDPDLEVLREIVAGTAGETGEAFFDGLVRHLARAIGKKCVWVTEWIERERRLRALAFWADGGYVRDFEYPISGTPCEEVVERRARVHVPERLLELYAGDPSLAPLGAVSYLGVPLLDTDGSLLGHLGVLHDAPLPEDPRVLGICNVFASRAAAELRRLRRERGIRERELKLSRVIGSAMDAIVELDGALGITAVNPAAERVFGCAAASLVGRPFADFLTQQARGKLAYLAAELGRRPESQPSSWIPDGFEGLRADGSRFEAEATVSRFELDGRPFHSLILRDVGERLEAEERIRTLLGEAAYLRAEIEALHGFDEIVGRSAALGRVLADVERVAGMDTTVLITGETGTGKELIARAIHRRSARASKPLIAVNCAAIASGLQESELFGHERGAFTGAIERRDGRFKLADGGTIFLDEVGEMASELQAKLLRVLQEGEFEPVGSSRPLRVDVRVVAATNRDLAALAREGRFRTDLLYRLDVFPLRMPPLRERGEDVLLLAEAFTRRLASRTGRRIAPLTEACREKLLAYDWPGNVRELQNVIERAVITSVDGRLNFDRALPDAPSKVNVPASASPKEPAEILTAVELRDIERENLLRALDAAGGKVAGPGGAAERLGMNANTLASRLKALGIRRARPPVDS